MTFEEWYGTEDFEYDSELASAAWTKGAASRDAEVAELRKDAERYRWLCNIGMSLFHPAFAASSITSWKTKEEIDGGIDRARGYTK